MVDILTDIENPNLDETIIGKHILSMGCPKTKNPNIKIPNVLWKFIDSKTLWPYIIIIIYIIFGNFILDEIPYMISIYSILLFSITGYIVQKYIKIPQKRRTFNDFSEAAATSINHRLGPTSSVKDWGKHFENLEKSFKPYKDWRESIDKCNNKIMESIRKLIIIIGIFFLSIMLWKRNAIIRDPKQMIIGMVFVTLCSSVGWYIEFSFSEYILFSGSYLFNKLAPSNESQNPGYSENRYYRWRLAKLYNEYIKGENDTTP